MAYNSGRMGQQQFAEGTPVYDADNAKVGTVSEVDPQGNYLVAQKGILFPHDVYIPLNAVTSGDANGVYLNLTKDDLKDERYKTQPAVGARGGTTMLDDDVETVTNRRTGTMKSAQPMAQPVVNQTPRTANRRPEAADQDTITVPVVEEELVAHKQREEIGHVHLHRDVTEEQESLNVPVTHEEVTVERVPVQGAGNIGPDAWQDKDIDVPVMGEEVTTEKRAHVNEEVRLRKQAVTENQQVTDTVRKERVEIEGLDQQGNMPLDQTNTP